MLSKIVLKLYSFGLQMLHNPNWTGMELYDFLKQHVRKRKKPTDMLYKTIKNGLLYHLGKWIYEYYLEYEDRFENGYLELRGEYLVWYLEDYIDFLIDLNISREDDLIMDSLELLDSIYKLYDEDEEKYWIKIEQEEEYIHWTISKLSREYNDKVNSVKKEYAKDFAERVFHDRMLCEYISKLIITIGFDGIVEENEEPKQWVERSNIPNWAKRAVIARDRGKCSFCNKNLILELESGYHIDHIIPISKSGTNDLCNLQLLCQNCNLSKSNDISSVETSIPEYLQIKLKNKLDS